MVAPRKEVIRRRDFMLVLPGAGLMLGISACTPGPTSQESSGSRQDKRRPQYQADSPQVQAFYRVNRYPEV